MLIEKYFRLISEIIPFNKPSPSPLKAGPKHSGRLISNRITRFAFSSTLSPLTHTQNRKKSRNLQNYHFMFVFLKNMSLQFSFFHKPFTFNWIPT